MSSAQEFGRLLERRTVAAAIDQHGVGGGDPTQQRQGGLGERHHPIIQTMDEKNLRRYSCKVRPCEDELIERGLTKLVIGYIESSGIEVVDSISLSISDNLMVGRLDPAALPGHASRLNWARRMGSC